MSTLQYNRHKISTFAQLDGRHLSHLSFLKLGEILSFLKRCVTSTVKHKQVCFDVRIGQMKNKGDWFLHI